MNREARGTRLFAVVDEKQGMSKWAEKLFVDQVLEARA